MQISACVKACEMPADAGHPRGHDRQAFHKAQGRKPWEMFRGRFVGLWRS